MIDIEIDNSTNLKHIRQIGAPAKENQIYIENAAYARVHEEDYASQRAFIFMGHTECRESGYATFIEAAIPVRDLEFSQNIPSWNTHIWSDVFHEIKRSYENSIIVGWALDCKGFAPRMTPALEAVHSEQFGGAHQVLLLMDTLEGEEYFYQNRGNHLQQKTGFYIYYARELHRIYPAEVTVEMPVRESAQSLPKNEKSKESKKSSYAIVAAVAVMVVMFGLGMVQGQFSFSQLGQAVQSMSEKVKSGIGNAEWLVGTEQEEAETEAVTESLDLVLMEQTPTENATEKNESSQAAQDYSDDDSGDDEETASAVVKPETYIVQNGDTLTAISKKIYGSSNRIKDIAELNKLENTDEIHEGQKLLLP
jgi:LysM repeat protein